MVATDDPLVIAGRAFSSRLIVGTGKFGSFEVMREALEASGTEMVTVALRRVDLEATGGPDVLDFIDPARYLILPNTSGAVDAYEAVRIARLARAAGLPDWVKLEVTPEPRYLLPDPVETLRAAERLVAEGFTVLPYINADPVLAKRLEEVSCATVMPLGSWIGSNKGLRTQIQIEVQVWSEAEYRRLVATGCEGVVIYQETYDPEAYARVHLGGRKRSFRWRLLGPERAARAGARRLGIGALFGLHDDWRYEAVAVAAHARFLQRRYWRSQVNVSLPRIRPSAAGYRPRAPISDRELAELVCALRLFLPDAGLVLSTREAPELRDGLVRIGITHMSAGSHTEPGGYEHPDEATEQFEIADTRSPAEVAARLRELGYVPVWEDWAVVTPAAERSLARAG